MLRHLMFLSLVTLALMPVRITLAATDSENCLRLMSSFLWQSVMPEISEPRFVRVSNRSVVGFSKDGSRLAVFDAKTGIVKRVYDLQEMFRQAGRQDKCAGGLCLVRSKGGTGWNLGMLVQSPNNSHGLQALAFHLAPGKSPTQIAEMDLPIDASLDAIRELTDGNVLIHTRRNAPIGNASIHSEGIFRNLVVDPRTGQRKFELAPDAEDVIPTSDGKFASTDADWTGAYIRIHNGETGHVERQYIIPNSGWFQRPMRLMEMKPNEFVGLLYDGGLEYYKLADAKSAVDGRTFILVPHQILQDRKAPSLAPLEKISPSEVTIMNPGGEPWMEWGHIPWWSADVASGKITQGEPSGRIITSLLLSPDKSKVLGGTNDGKLILWNRTSGKITAVKDANVGQPAAVFVSGTDDGQVFIKHGFDGKVVHAFSADIWSELKTDGDVSTASLFTSTIDRGHPARYSDYHGDSYSWSVREPSKGPDYLKNILEHVTLRDETLVFLRSQGFAMPMLSTSPPRRVFFKDFIDIVRKDGSIVTLKPVDGMTFKNLAVEKDAGGELAFTAQLLPITGVATTTTIKPRTVRFGADGKQK